MEAEKQGRMDELNESTAWREFQSTIQGADLEKETAFHFARIGDVAGLSKEIHLPEALDWKDEKGNSLLLLSSYHGHEDLTRHLLEWGANPNESDRSGNSVLMGASFKGHLAVVSLLLRFGADPNYKNPQGFTALDYATMFGRKKIVTYLTTYPISRIKGNQKKWILWIQFFLQTIRNTFLKNKKEAQI
ncbi:ankyrin repeat domain-containing protein [Leptospira congkakensis]|uniref:Ankyrin repeat domain-containing protein n=1 Tax=Leptospira congkakensis TaxID=2484932 RepID=A0A4Z1A4H6_9LEPT|nr:ankyrin repeat domain-containing protein [Leptospira congkakensis]TGL87200.1 ankyrin repeat domain-containing protein [Leptospira congkakensis]TGL96767.1 ankyrin repeat domain-containing protein [Leptospira congkakensis]TGL97617.1 ankyrin repeat domain-containing protein [Leptospira congkakensis]